MRRGLLFACVAAALALVAPVRAGGQSLPTLTGPVNDFAHVLTRDESDLLERRIRSLLSSSPKKDAVIVATVDSFEPYGSIEEYAVKLFEKAGPGQSKIDNGILIVLAMKERKVRIEVGYDLEEFITAGFAGETIRQFMLPEFRRGAYGAGLIAGTTRVIQRVAEGRGITLSDVPPPTARDRGQSPGLSTIIVIIVIIIVVGRVFRRIGGPPGFGGGRIYRGGPWSGWTGGVGGFGGGFGGFGGGGGGFGGFGGGHSGGGGASGGW